MIPHDHWQPNYVGLLWISGTGIVLFLLCLIIERKRK